MSGVEVNVFPSTPLIITIGRMMISIRFPIAPVPKQRPRFNRRGRAYTPEKTRLFELHLKTLAAQAYKGDVLQGPLSIAVRLGLERPPSVKKRQYPMVKPDIDNFLKSIVDALNRIIWKDDAQIVDCHISKEYAVGNGWVELDVKEMNDG